MERAREPAWGWSWAEPPGTRKTAMPQLSRVRLPGGVTTARPPPAKPTHPYLLPFHLIMRPLRPQKPETLGHIRGMELSGEVRRGL